MAPYVNPVRGILESNQELPPFSAQQLFLPGSHGCRSPHGAITKFEIPSFKWLPFKIEFPIDCDPKSDCCTESAQFMGYCKQALAVEKRIRDIILSSISQMTPDQSGLFQTELSHHSAAQHLLRRLYGLQESKLQVVPGVFLGTKKSDRTLGDVLQEQLSKTWRLMDLPIPDALITACQEWGEVQLLARASIIESAWRSLVVRANWPIPSAFDEYMGHFLEGKIPESHCDQFWSWLSQIETLAESNLSPSLHLLPKIRNWHSMKQQDAALPTELLEELSDKEFPIWERYLVDPSSVSACDLTKELFPSEHSRPIDVEYRLGTPYRISITEQQANDFWKDYITHYDPSEIKIVYATEKEKALWCRLDRGAEMRELAATPLSQFITEIDIDGQNLSEKDCLRLFKEKLKLLDALGTGLVWRNLETPQTITVTFRNISLRTQALLQLKCLEGDDDLFSTWEPQELSSELSQDSCVTLRLPYRYNVEQDEK